jgi:hypothetical protein
VVVFSGYGLQAYWLLKEAALIESEQDRDYLANLAAGWTNAIRYLAAKNGWDQDATGDLPRVLRCPGTWNNKDPENPKLVTTVKLDGRRYTLDEVAKWATEHGHDPREGGQGSRRNGKVALPDVKLAELPPPDPDKLEALLDNSDKARKTWEKKRPDLTDQSQSGYDLSIASQAIQAGMSEEDTLKLLVYFRVKHKQDLKRMDYYEQTIAKAKSQRTQEDLDEAEDQDEGPDQEDLDQAEDQAEDEDEGSADDAKADTPTPPDPDAARTKALADLRKKLKLPIVRVIKRGQGRRASYDLELADGTLIMLGSAADTLAPLKVEAAIFGVVGKTIKKTFTRAQWKPIADHIGAAAEAVATETETEEVEAWLQAYLSEQHHSLRAIDVIDMQDTAALYQRLTATNVKNAPFRDTQGQVYISLDAFFRWIAITNYGERAKRKEVTEDLTRVGFLRERVQARDGARIAKQRRWVSPRGWWSDDYQYTHSSWIGGVIGDEP